MLACLIHSSILFAQYKQLLKRFHPLRLQPPRIHQLPLLLHPIQHIMLLNPMLRRIPMIHLNETLHLLKSYFPSLVLRHNNLAQTGSLNPPCHPSSITHHPSNIQTSDYILPCQYSVSILLDIRLELLTPHPPDACMHSHQHLSRPSRRKVSSS